MAGLLFRWLLTPTIVVIANAACSPVETRSVDSFTQNGELIALSGGGAGAPNACFTCHGLDGRGNGAGAPRLAALDAGYLDRQLIAYADGRRRHPEMQWIARRLSARDRQAVAAYYETMAFAPDEAIALPAGHSRLYVQGDPARRIPACSQCHGRWGEGAGPANPPLAGQPAGYLADQLRRWRRSERRTDPGNVMLFVSQRLTAREAEEVSAYAAALPGGPRRQVPRAASR